MESARPRDLVAAGVSSARAETEHTAYGNHANQMMIREDDASLVQAAQRGDRPAFGQLYERYGRLVHGILLARVPSPEVDDLVQEVFLKALRELRGLRDHAAFGGWLAQIARNRAVDYFRKSRASVELPAALPARENTAARTEAVAALETIRGLPEAYRDTLILRLVEGMTGPEIAARTGLTPDSVRVNLHRGMKLLRQSLERRTISDERQ
jgi:RNA polymerase sigma-70 factor, ECF subfamily